MVSTVVFPPLEQMRARRSAKWTLYDDDVLPMPVAEMDCLLAPAIVTALEAAIRRGDAGYPPMDGEPEQAFREFAADRWGWRPANVWMGPDVSVAGIEVLGAALARGSRVAISSPVYPPFHRWPGRAGMTLAEVALLGPERGWRLDLEGLDRAFADGVAAYVLCHPHNPVGRVWSREELAALAEVADAHGVLVVSDEIHAPLTFPGIEFVPYLNVSDAARRTGVALHSPSKAWNLAGLKCAFIATAGELPAQRLEHLHPTLNWQAGILGALGAVAAYRDGRDWLDELLPLIEANHALLGEELAREMPQARCVPAEAGYLAWVDVRACGYQGDPAAQILRRGRLALGIGPTFGEPGRGHVRVNLGCAAELIPEAVRRMVAARAGCPVTS